MQFCWDSCIADPAITIHVLHRLSIFWVYRRYSTSGKQWSITWQESLRFSTACQGSAVNQYKEGSPCSQDYIFHTVPFNKPRSESTVEHLQILANDSINSLCLTVQKVTHNLMFLLYFRRKNSFPISSIAPGCWSRRVCVSVPVLTLNYQKEPTTSGTEPWKEVVSWEALEALGSTIPKNVNVFTIVLLLFITSPHSPLPFGLKTFLLFECALTP